MKIQPTQKTIQQISQSISQNPLWALLRANEYLTKESALRQALRLKASNAMETLTYSSKALNFAEEILAGKTLRELPDLSTEEIRPEKLQQAKLRQKIFKIYKTALDEKSYVKNKAPYQKIERNLDSALEVEKKRVHFQTNFLKISIG